MEMLIGLACSGCCCLVVVLVLGGIGFFFMKGKGPKVEVDPDGGLVVDVDEASAEGDQASTSTPEPATDEADESAADEPTAAPEGRADPVAPPPSISPRQGGATIIAFDEDDEDE